MDYLFLCHAHLDHVGRAPLLFGRGAAPVVYVPKGNLRLLQDIYTDSLKILTKEAETLSRQLERQVEPLYTRENIDTLLSHIKEVPFDTIVKVNENLSFRFVDSGHILDAAQLELWITSGNTTKKILYTSDLGNVKIPKYYVRPLHKVDKANLVIGECTYGDEGRGEATLSKRSKDLQKLREIITETCIENKSKVLIPVFALDRAQTILTILNEIFGDDTSFKVPIVLDTPLGLRHFKTYFNNLDEAAAAPLHKAMGWANLIQVNEWTESRYWAQTDTPCVILASSGMLQNGRVLTYLPYILTNWRNKILFCGFLSENSLGWKIKNEKDKWVKVNGEFYANRCGIVTLNSFSSHIQFSDLLDYYSEINCEKIALVHGEMKTKISFGKRLQSLLSSKGKSTKVIIVNKSTKIKL